MVRVEIRHRPPSGNAPAFPLLQGFNHDSRHPAGQRGTVVYGRLARPLEQGVVELEGHVAVHPLTLVWPRHFRQAQKLCTRFRPAAGQYCRP